MALFVGLDVADMSQRTMYVRTIVRVPPIVIAYLGQ
jgi:hypothetical protein